MVNIKSSGITGLVFLFVSLLFWTSTASAQIVITQEWVAVGGGAILVMGYDKGLNSKTRPTLGATYDGANRLLNVIASPASEKFWYQAFCNGNGGTHYTWRELYVPRAQVVGYMIDCGNNTGTFEVPFWRAPGNKKIVVPIKRTK